MKISQENIRKFEQSEQEKTDLFYFDGEIENNIAAAANSNFLTENPAAAVLAAGVAVAAPLAGMAFTNGMVSQAAELPQNQDVQATYVETAGEADTVEVVSQIEQKVVNFTANGPGHIEPAENCVIDGTTGEIKFIDSDQNAAFTIVYDVDGATSRISAGNSVMPDGTDYVILEAHGSYSTINIEFTDVVAEQQRAEAEAARQAAEQAAADAAAQQQAQQAAAQAAAQQTTTARQAAPTPAPAPAQHQQQQAAPARQSTPAPAQHQQAANAAPFSGAAQHSMNAVEMAEARQIFDSYNQFRASKGLPQLAWSDDCANMAFGSATGCAASGKLTHKLGIPGAVQGNYSDILQYSTWKMTGAEAVHRWSQSDGHRKMMQCNTAQVAGVGAYNNGGTWYYAIVYNFQGTNQSGA